jgi:hypothetical protein
MTDTLLNQVVAAEKGIKDSVNKETAPIFHDTKRPELFAGHSKTYEALNAEDTEVLPPDEKRVQLTVGEVLDAFAKPMTKLLDVILTKETANTQAFADVVVDGETVIPQAPVSFLLQLEKQLTQEVRGLIVSLPTLDTAYEWEETSSERGGVVETKPQQRHRTKKVTRPITLAPATDKHPAQVQLVNEDVLTGYWNEKRFSGAVSAQRKRELLEKVDKLIVAVKYAREQANSRTVEQKTCGADVFGFLFA